MNTVLHDSLRAAFNEFKDKPLFSEERPYDKWMTYGEVAARSERLACVLSRFLAGEKPPYTVCIYSKNRAAWVISDFACALAGITSVGLHTSWPLEEAAHVLNETSTAIVIASAEQLDKVFAAKCPRLRCVVSMDGAASLLPYASKASEMGVRCISFDDIPEYCPESLEECMKETDAFLARPEQDTPYATVIYSSGTTNSPKGLGVRKETWEGDARSSPFDAAEKVAVSCSPLAHGMDRGFVWQAVYCGGRVGFARSGDYANLTEDIRLINPGVFVSMPNLWNRLYDDYRRRIRQLAAAKICGMLLPGSAAGDDDAVTKLGMVLDVFETLATTVGRDKLAAEYPIVNEVRTAAMEEARGFLGKNIKVIGTGGDFTSDSVMEFLRECYAGANVVNSYGTTEVPGISSNGVINEAIEVKLVDAPEAGLSTEDKPAPRGEIVCRPRKSRRMETRYWGDSELAREQSAKAFRDGWYYTGDAGSIDPATHRLTIIGRTRDVAEIYLNGRSVWIPLSKINPIFRSCPGVRNIYIHSDRSQEYLIAVVSVAECGRGTTVEEESYEMLCRLRRAGRSAGLERHEIPKSVVLTADQWTAQNGCLSATGKLRRGKIGEKYKTAIDAEYSRLEAIDNELAAFGARVRGNRRFDYIDYDFAARPNYYKQDGIRLSEIYSEMRKVVTALRVDGPLATARLKAGEDEIRESIKRTKESMLRECERAAEMDKVAAVDKLLAMGRTLKLKHKDLLDAQRKSDPKIAELTHAFAALADKLKATADEMCVSVPYQITAGLVIRPLPPEGEEANALPESEGPMEWRVECACCNDLIEWGSFGAGTPRHKCMSCCDKGTHSAQSLCTDCYRVLSSLLSSAKAAEMIRSGIVPCFALGHSFTVETLSTMWIREKIIDLRDHRLGTTLQRAFEWYGARPCICSSRNALCWSTYKDVWENACRFASGLKSAGVQRGSVVCLVDSPKTRALLWPVCEFGCAIAGYVLCVLGNPATARLPRGAAAVVVVAASADEKTALPSEFDKLVFDDILKNGTPDFACDECATKDETFAICVNPQGEFVGYKTDSVWERLRSTSEFYEPYVQAMVAGSPMTMFDRLRLWDVVLNGGRMAIVDDASEYPAVSPTKVFLTPAEGLQLSQAGGTFEEKVKNMKARFGERVSKVVLDASSVSKGDKETVEKVRSLFNTLSVDILVVRDPAGTGNIIKEDYSRFYHLCVF